MRWLGYIALVFAFGCSKQSSLSKEAYVSFVNSEESGLIKSKEIGEFTFEAFYRPYDYIAIQELKKATLSSEEVASKKKELAGLHYLNLKIEGAPGLGLLETDATSDQDYNLRLYYYTSEAQLDMQLIQDQDTMPCVLYHFERNYQLAPYNNIVLGFEPTNQEINYTKDIEFVYNDRVLNTGPIRMVFNADQLNTLPTLKL